MGGWTESDAPTWFSSSRCIASGSFVVPPARPQCAGAWERYSHGRFTRLLCETCGQAVPLTAADP